MENMWWEIRAKLVQGPALASFEEIKQGQNNLVSLPDLNQDRDTSTLDSDEEADGLYISDESDD